MTRTQAAYVWVPLTRTQVERKTGFPHRSDGYVWVSISVCVHRRRGTRWLRWQVKAQIPYIHRCSIAIFGSVLSDSSTIFCCKRSCILSLLAATRCRGVMLKVTSHRQAALLRSALVVCWLASGSDRDSSLTLTIDCVHLFLHSNFCDLEINSQFAIIAYSQLKPDLRYINIQTRAEHTAELYASR